MKSIYTHIALLTTLSATLFSCAPQKQTTLPPNFSTEVQSSNIIGGTEADQAFAHEHGLVGLYIMKTVLAIGPDGQPTEIEKGYLCTGTLIARNIVLTAAHCIEYSPQLGSKLRVVAYFKTNIKDVSQADIINVDMGLQHEDYLKDITDATPITNNWNDIALLRLSKDAPAEVKVSKIATKTEKLNLKQNSQLILAGYGITTPIIAQEAIDPVTGKKSIIRVPSEGSGQLRLVEGIPVVKVANKKKEIQINQIQNDKITLKGACHGDSGGPAFLKRDDGSFVQVGVTSRGTEELGNCNRGAIYTGIQGHSDWIATTMAQMLAAPKSQDQ